MSEMARETTAAAAAGAGSEKPVDLGDSKYKGVRKRKWGKWVSEVRLPNSRERIWLGSYDSAEKAARAFDAAQFCLRGRNARFNFPDDPPDIAGGRSLTPSEIQVAAARFANSAAPAAASEPPRRNSNNRDLSSEYQPAARELQAESASPSMSEGTVQMDCDLGVDMDMDMGMGGPFMDLVRSNMGSGNYASDYGLYPGYDEFTTNDYFGSTTAPNMGFGDENFDGLPVQDSFLWNF
ncbi:ethylene-responsive transcription factor ERF017-like [Rhodamnia argentea]|uniref:Ethylene-responsive transcription factor ERF017-like n=1 Tax=Rhodamnia argentea TaxID=178133 RepID=A0A8B8P739_9MYRT|nr:ethylene-responsive transcription factor ERF017-like [Rhodamnia argentea]